MYNFCSIVTDHDDFLPAVVTTQFPHARSQCTSTHSATTHDVTVGLHPRPHTVVSPTRNVVPSTCIVPTDTRVVATSTCTTPSSTCTVVTPSHTVAQYTRPVDSHAYTVASTTSTPASSAASVARSIDTVAPATVRTVATDTVTVTSPPACDPGLSCARFNHGLAPTPRSHAESITYRTNPTSDIFGNMRLAHAYLLLHAYYTTLCCTVLHYQICTRSTR